MMKRAKIVAGIVDLMDPNDPNHFVRMADLRTHVPIESDEFDQAVLELWRAGAIYLVADESESEGSINGFSYISLATK